MNRAVSPACGHRRILLANPRWIWGRGSVEKECGQPLHGVPLQLHHTAPQIAVCSPHNSRSSPLPSRPRPILASHCRTRQNPLRPVTR
uniref:Uncharacterized protein n=1 Tax=Arundo donax TaxID=35708 RepID=A0A0A9CKY4_ARUDO